MQNLETKFKNYLKQGASNRHLLAKKDDDKFTVGESAKILRKKFNDKTISAKELQNFANEWHHAGIFDKNGKLSGKRVYFLNKQEINNITYENIIENREKEQIKVDKCNTENEIKNNMVVFGFYYIWNAGYIRGKRHKELCFYKGNGHTPDNFIELTEEQYKELKHHEGKIYTGWDEPTYEEVINFQTISDKKRLLINLKQRQYRARKKKEKQEQLKQEKKNEFLEKLTNENIILLKDFFKNGTHPAPLEIYNIKKESNTSWRELKKFVNNKK